MLTKEPSLRIFLSSNLFLQHLRPQSVLGLSLTLLSGLLTLGPPKATCPLAPNIHRGLALGLVHCPGPGPYFCQEMKTELSRL